MLLYFGEKVNGKRNKMRLPNRYEVKLAIVDKTKQLKFEEIKALLEGILEAELEKAVPGTFEVTILSMRTAQE